MKFSHCLADREFTVVNTEFNHERVMASLPENGNKENQIRLVSIPDGMEPRPEPFRQAFPTITDENMGWVVQVAKNMGISVALFWSAAVGLRALILHIPQLIETGILDSDGNFLAEDSTCLSWLDQQPTRSVIYLAFGSTTILNKNQFHELALGLELAGQPFLWVVRPSLINEQIDAYPDGFQARVANRSRIVGWAPQQKVLAHPSIACFVTHCGWNSTTEGVAMGVPFLCWAYFCDQFLNQSYICDVWKVGLQLNKNDGQALLVDEMIRARALEFKEISKRSVSEGGSSMINLNDFIESVKSN
ncbi:hypothetical protein MKX01_008601 [Papaver californicum]|nr:hypothetical protein MKX01_008601 [Papaver californicum]